MCAVRERDYRRQLGIFKAGETAGKQVEEKGFALRVKGMLACGSKKERLGRVEDQS